VIIQEKTHYAGNASQALYKYNLRREMTYYVQEIAGKGAFALNTNGDVHLKGEYMDQVLILEQPYILFSHSQIITIRSGVRLKLAQLMTK
jgi:hypothetical protein